MNDSRQQFEAWVSGRTVVNKYGAKLTQRVDGSYADYRINDRWLAWQAREASMYDMTKAYNDVAALIPDSRYMDPPDGGDVEVAEQIRRMIADKVRQAFIAGIAQGRKGLPEWTDGMATEEYTRGCYVMKTDYAKKKLTSLLAEIDCYAADEFERQMLRIIEGATGKDMPSFDYQYPVDIFHRLLSENSPYAFYLLPWVPYQDIKGEITAQTWRLKMQHDVKTFDGRQAFGIWPNGSSCGPFKDSEVEFIRISAKQFGSVAYIDPRPQDTAL